MSELITTCPRCRGKLAARISQEHNCVFLLCELCDSVFAAFHILPDNGLRECPHCFGHNLFVDFNELSQEFSVLCRNCRASGPVCDSREDAVNLWNRRGGIYKTIPHLSEFAQDMLDCLKKLNSRSMDTQTDELLARIELRNREGEDFDNRTVFVQDVCELLRGILHGIDAHDASPNEEFSLAREAARDFLAQFSEVHLDSVH